MGNAMTDHALDEEIANMREIESKMSSGIKVPYSSLEWYLRRKEEGFHDTWRHKESETVYEFVGLGLASTGEGQLVLMVHYVPEGHASPKFERQYAKFVERFEPVAARRVWDRVG